MLSATLLALPVAAGMTVPATATEPVRYVDSGTHVQASGTVVGTIDGVEGNVHVVRVEAEDEVFAIGSLENWSCPDGVSDPGKDPGCSPLGSADLGRDRWTVTASRDRTSGRLTGTFDVIVWVCDEVDCVPVHGPALEVDVTVASETRPQTYSSITLYRDPVTGVSYRGRLVQTYAPGDASGTVGGLELLDGTGVTDTFTFRAVERS